MYADQLEKIKENVRMYKEAVSRLQAQLKEQESRGLSQHQLQTMNVLFTGLKDDNQKLADDIRFT